MKVTISNPGNNCVKISDLAPGDLFVFTPEAARKPELIVMKAAPGIRDADGDVTNFYVVSGRPGHAHVGTTVYPIEGELVIKGVRV